MSKVGFKLNYGPDNSGWTLMAWKNAGGYYLGALFFEKILAKMGLVISSPQRSERVS